MKWIHLPLVFLVALPLFAPLAARAAQTTPSCASIAEDSGERFGVPKGLMAAISLVETGTGGNSWPWTLNEGGKGMHFDTKEKALAYLQAAIERGVTNIDVGCMQLNYRWHHAGFKSPEQMLDPQLNTSYAALFLVELRKRLGSWQDATANYHSADAERGAKYVEKVVRANGETPETTQMADAAPEETANGDLQGLLMASGQPLVTLGAADSDFYARVAQSVADATSDSPAVRTEPVVLKTRDSVPPRLGRRWDAVLAARLQLAARP
jgi:hypothetical protein